MDCYQDRHHAGLVLAEALQDYKNRKDTLLLALPRGGVPVAYEIAKKLHLPLDVFIVRKLGVPGHAELAMGALASGNMRVFNDHIIEVCNVSESEIEVVIAKEQQELKRREVLYRDDLPLPELTNKTLILVDDGIATGATVRAAIKALRQFHPKEIIVAVPVADINLAYEIEQEVDRLICPLRTPQLNAVGNWYINFSQTEDEEVALILKEVRQISTA